MIRNGCWALIGALLALLPSACDSPRVASGNALPSHVSTLALDDFAHALTGKLHLPGAALAIVQGDSVYYATAGLANLEKQIPFTDTTTFFAGNLSEPMVAAAIMKLVNAGELNLDDPVVKHLPYFKLGDNAYRSITIRHLLTHTSGIPHHDAIWDLPDTSAHALEATARSISEQPSLFEPGSQVKRSPYNYDIAATLIEQVTGMPFEAYASTRLLGPSGMHHTTFRKSDIAPENLCLPYFIDNWLSYNVKPASLYPYNREHAGSIGLHSTIRDLTTWVHTLLNHPQKFSTDGELLKPQQQTAENFYMGLGWEIEQFNGRLLFKKTHQLGGFSADITLVPELKTGVVTVSNVGDDFNPAAVSHQLMAFATEGTPLEIKIPVHLAMGRHLARTGSLDSAFTLFATLREENNTSYNLSEEALNQFGVNLLYRVHDIEKSRAVFLFCLQQYPSSSHAHLNLAEAYLMDNKAEQASAEIALAKKLIPTPEMISRIRYIEEILAEKKEKDPSTVPTKP